MGQHRSEGSRQAVGMLCVPMSIQYCCMYMYSIQQSSESGYSHIIIEGNFNYPEIEWTTWATNMSAEHHSQKYIDTCRDAYLYLHIQEPTGYRHGQ